MTHPNNLNSSAENSPGPVFRVGAPGYSGELSAEGRRLFYWAPSAEDHLFSEAAGWSNLVVPQTEWQTLNDQSQLVVPAAWLELPSTTASASSVLAGTEAWLGQKKEVVDFVVGYAQRVYAEHNVVDTSVNLDTVGVTRGNEQIFVVPPHYAEHDQSTAGVWLSVVYHDLEAVLRTEPNREELLNDFQNGMSFLNGDQ
jgi:hypothetical protein